MPNDKKARVKAVVKRWVRWLCLVVVGTAICVALQGYLGKAANYLGRSVGYLPIVAMLLGAGLSGMGGPSPGHFRRRRLLLQIRWAPAWSAGIAGFVAYALIVTAHPLQAVWWAGWRAPVYLLLFFALLTAGAGLRVFLKGNKKEAAKDSVPEKQKNLLDASTDELLRWAMKDKPITHPNEDGFDHAPIARRVARVLADDATCTVGIFGLYGCGKSSIQRMTMHSLAKKDPNILNCVVEGWGLREGNVAHHILSNVVSRLAEEVDCLSIASLPAQYTAAMSGADWPGAKVVARLLSTNHDPIAVLEQANDILLAIGKRLIIFLEDLDRNVGEEAKVELAALLDRLVPLTHISFVLAVAPGTIGGPALTRVCRHIEIIPALPQDRMIAIIRRLRLHWWEEMAKEHIDPDEERHNELSAPRPSFDAEKMAIMMDIAFEDHGRPWTGSIATLMATPRQLKHFLRRAHCAWEQLRGEIDLDDLLVCLAIRESVPELYGFVLQNMEALRGNVFSVLPDGKKKKIEALQEKQEKVLEELHLTDEQRKAADSLIKYLFDREDGQCLPRQRPQRVAVSEPTDYFARLNAEEVGPNDLKDQEVLRGIEEWGRSKTAIVLEGKTLPELFSQDGLWQRKLEHFAKSFKGDEVLDLASSVHDILLDDGPQSSGDSSAFHALRRMFLELPDAQLDEWGLGEFRKALPISLRFAASLLRKTYVISDHFGSSACSSHFREEAFNYAQEFFEGDGQKFLKALDASYGSTVRIFCSWCNPDGPSDGKWHWLGDVLIAAGAIDKTVILPQLADLLVQSESDSPEREPGKHEPSEESPPPFKHEFSLQRAQQIFGEDLTTLMQLLSQEINLVEAPDDHIPGALRVAQEYAKKWLAENPRQ